MTKESKTMSLIYQSLFNLYMLSYFIQEINKTEVALMISTSLILFCKTVYFSCNTWVK